MQCNCKHSGITVWRDCSAVLPFCFLSAPVGSPPSAVTRQTFSGHLHFIRNTRESLVSHSKYACHSLLHFSFTCLSLVPSECLLNDISNLEASSHKAFTNLLVFSKGFAYFSTFYFISIPPFSLFGLFPDTPRSFSLSEAHLDTND